MLLQVLSDGPDLLVFLTDNTPLRNHRDLMQAGKNKTVAFGQALIRQGVHLNRMTSILR